MITKRVLDDFPKAGELAQLGAIAKRTYDLIEKHSVSARGYWVKLGELGADVKDSSPRGAGILRRWRETYLGKVTDIELSNAIWCYRHPDALQFVKKTITDPGNIRQSWRKHADEVVQSFILQRRNDVEALAKEIGTTALEARNMLDAAQAKPSREATRAAARREPDDDLAEVFDNDLAADSPIRTADPWAALKVAIDTIEAGRADGPLTASVEEALTVMRSALRRGAR